MDRIQIGIVAKPQGIKGELKINSLTDENSRFIKLKNVYIDNILVKVLSVRVSGRDVFLSLNGVADRNAAETYRGKSIYIDKVDAVKLPSDRYFITDMIGCEVIDENNKNYGKVIEVLQHGAADVFELSSGTMFPFLDRVISDIDIDKKKIFVYSQKFDEVAVYED